MVTIDGSDQFVDVASLITINGQENEAGDEGQEENAPSKISDGSFSVEDAIDLGKSIESISILCNNISFSFLSRLVLILFDIVIVVLVYLVTHIFL